MKKVAIYGQTYSVTAHKEILVLLKALDNRSIVVFLERDFYNALQQEVVLDKKYPTFSSHEDLNASFDLFFTLGGDGTMLRAITYVRDLGIPLLGVNTGRLGFLATVKKEEIEAAVEQLLQGEYSLQERTLLTISTQPGADKLQDMSFALNEITIARKNTTSMSPS